jgi:hypothetical protein
METRNLSPSPLIAAVQRDNLDTRRSTRSAASLGSSCSQTRSTVHPCSASTRSVAASRSRFRSNLRCQNSAFVLGCVPCTGQECQKQPSTYMATRTGPRTTSARDLISGIGARSTRKRNPRRCNSERRASSGAVSRLPTRDISALLAGDGCVRRVGLVMLTPTPPSHEIAPLPAMVQARKFGDHFPKKP